MKRIETFLPVDNTKTVLDKLEKQGFKGLTLMQALGRGSGERPWIGGSEGHEIEFNAINCIIMVVEDSQEDEAVKFIVNSAFTGSSGDGKIFITNVERSVDVFKDHL